MRQRLYLFFFYMEKAYDKTWRYGIMWDIHQAGLRGKLPLFINYILHNRMFQMKLQHCYTRRRIQESGVAQGSTISVSLFAIKINSLSKVIPKEIHASMFVDDIQIAYSHQDINQLQSVMQKAVNNIANWANNNGFTFSTTKTVTMQFYKTRAPLLQPKIYLNNKLIPEMSTVKFLRLVWDPKLTWISHIAQLKISV